MSELQGSLPGSGDKLLNTKLMAPHPHSMIIQRGELLARLDACLTKKLAVVCAPTGFGKTTLVSAWIAHHDFPCAWVTLDENDNDPSRFWTYFISALRTFEKAPGKSTLGKGSLSALMTSQQPSFERLLTPLINELMGLKESCVLVLEDYQVVHSTEINRGLAFLIQHLPESLHLVLITRNDPDLPLEILRARDELLEIKASNLRFNQAETEAFLRDTLKAEFPSELAAKLLEQTEGWVAGLRLAALSMQNRTGAADIQRLAQTFSGNDRYVADYLVKEVFEGQSETTRSFLLETCFLSRLTGSLCDAITGGNQGASTLERLERENLFVVRLQPGTHPTWYRYNPLFANPSSI